MTPTVLEVGPAVHFVEASHTNFVLIEDGDEVTLVDSGYPKDRELVDASVQQIGRGLGEVSAMLLTHAHVDHLGSAERLRERFGVPVHCHAGEAAHARGEVDEVISERDLFLRAWRPGVLRFTVNAVARGGLRPQRVKEVSTFLGGGTVDVPGRPHAIHTPGHTSGHVGFHLPDRGVVISGDALITVDVWDHSNRGPQVIRAPFNHDHTQAIASLACFEALEAGVVIPGHGRPFRGTPAQAVEEARLRAHEVRPQGETDGRQNSVGLIGAVVGVPLPAHRPRPSAGTGGMRVVSADDRCLATTVVEVFSGLRRVRAGGRW